MKTGDALRVNSRTFDSIIKEFDLLNIELLKLDIEGAEVEVLNDMFSKGIFPSPILIKIDEVLYPSRFSQTRVNLGSEGHNINGCRAFYMRQADFIFFKSTVK